jgi:primosomal protein N' (replication factor Y)
MGRSKPSDTTGYLWIEEGDRHEGVVAEVAPIPRVERTYSFAVPDAMEENLSIGQRVMVPLGRRGRLVQGFVVSLDRRVWDSSLRPVDSVVDSASFLTPDLVELGREMAEHYVCPLGRTLKAVTPEAVRRQSGLKTIRYARLIRTIDEIRADATRIGARQQALLDGLAESGEPVAVDWLLERAGASSATLRGLTKKGWVELTERKELRDVACFDVPMTEPAFDLNQEQCEALERISRRIDENRFSVTLAYGVSGSGKTELYIRAMRRVLASGRQAILLVPEIVLTTQLVQRLASRFADVAVNHSGLTDAQRSVIWRQVAAGEKKVVIGTRSAVFAPCPNLGLICVDEEQETSYKNLQAPRFHVRDVAIMRARQLDIPVVLGSATPSVEVWHRSGEHPDYQRVILRKRVKALPMPQVYLIDMRDEWAEVKQAVVLSRSMDRMLTETLERGEQALILINRRGFANRIYCPVCKSQIDCPNCNVPLVVHTASGQSICHYCRCRIPTPTVCPNVMCGAALVQQGLGTQRVEEVLRSRFPDAAIQRVDSDTMKHRDEYQRIVDDFEARKIDVLVGTQMIAKGLDFPFVSFVGVVNADPSGLATDFRAHERLFHLITQVAGRAGRADVPGRVVVQTTIPNMPALKFALKHDYESFVTEELEVRRRVGLPPFRRLARVVLAHPREERARQEAEALADRVREAIDAASLELADVQGPNPCALSRLRGKYRYDLLIRTANASAMRQLMGSLKESGALRTKAESTIVDVDPVSLT